MKLVKIKTQMKLEEIITGKKKMKQKQGLFSKRVSFDNQKREPRILIYHRPIIIFWKKFSNGQPLKRKEGTLYNFVG